MWSLQFYAGIVVLLLLDSQVEGDHFKFATISCRPHPADALQVVCTWRSAWALNSGPCYYPCTQDKIGLLTDGVYGQWECSFGCGSTINIAPHQYYLTAIDSIEDYQQGRNDFFYTWPGPGVFHFGFSGCCWATLVNGGDGWNIYTQYNAGVRSDTGKPNASPVTATVPITDMVVSCGYRFDIPYADPDGDTVRCRWATGDECGGICGPLPGSTLYPNCTLIIPASARPLYTNGLYGIAVTIEDFPAGSITQGGVQKDETTPLSKVPLQYLAKIMDGCDCDNLPAFQDPPVTVNFLLGTTYKKGIVATSSYGVSAINVVPPTGAIVGTMVKVNGTTVSVGISWTPTSAQLGETLLCYQAIGGDGCPGPYQCDTIQVGANGGWCPYGEWGDCSVTCETGKQARSRVCKCPGPSYGGVDCEGSDTETRTCTGPCCPVDGYLSDWSPWSPCSATCGLPGTVIRWRTKECIYPDPKCPGDDCGELPVEYENCTQQPCCLKMNETESSSSFQYDSGNRLHDVKVVFNGANTYEKYVTFKCGIVLIESIQNYDETYVAAVQAAVTEECVDYLSPVCHVTIPAPYGCPCVVMINYTCCDVLY